MTRGGRGGAAPTGSGEAFRLWPVAWAHAAKPGDAAYRYDLNAEVAAALMDAAQQTLRTWSIEGRVRADDGTRHRLRAWQPYGRRPHSRRYYALEDLEMFAVDAWVRPRSIRYELIPHWYLRKHGRMDLAGVAKPAPPTPARLVDGVVLRPIPPEEQEALDLGYPRGAYVEHHSTGVSVWSPGGVLLNPGPLDSQEARLAAAAEIAHMQT